MLYRIEVDRSRIESVAGNFIKLLIGSKVFWKLMHLLHFLEVQKLVIFHSIRPFPYSTTFQLCSYAII